MRKKRKTMFFSNDYDLVGFAQIEGEPIYLSGGTFKFLCDGVTRTLSKQVKENIKPVDVRSGWTCDPETRTGTYRTTTSARSYTAFLNVGTVNANNAHIEAGGLYSLITGEYPHIDKQLTKGPHHQPGTVKSYPVSRNIAFEHFKVLPDMPEGARTGNIDLIYKVKTHEPVGEIRDNKVYVYPEADAISLIAHELQRVLNMSDILDHNILFEDPREPEPTLTLDDI